MQVIVQVSCVGIKYELQGNLETILSNRHADYWLQNTWEMFWFSLSFNMFSNTFNSRQKLSSVQTYLMQYVGQRTEISHTFCMHLITFMSLKPSWSQLSFEGFFQPNMCTLFIERPYPACWREMHEAVDSTWNGQRKLSSQCKLRIDW